MIDHKSLLEGRDMSSKYYQGPYIDFDVDFYYLRYKTSSEIPYSRCKVYEFRHWKVKV